MARRKATKMGLLRTSHPFVAANHRDAEPGQDERHAERPDAPGHRTKQVRHRGQSDVADSAEIQIANELRNRIVDAKPNNIA